MMDLSENMKCWCCYDDIKLDTCAMLLSSQNRRGKGSKRHGLCEICFTKTKRFLEERRRFKIHQLRQEAKYDKNIITVQQEGNA